MKHTDQKDDYLHGLSDYFSEEEWQEISATAVYIEREKRVLRITRDYARLRKRLLERFGPHLVDFLMKILWNIDFEKKGRKGFQLKEENLNE